MTWRPATVEEIDRYYAEEFPTHVDHLPEFLTATGPKQYALAFREAHPVRSDERPSKEFIRRDTRQTNEAGEPTIQVFDQFEDVIDFIRHPARNDPLAPSEYALADPALLEKTAPRPAAVYYALDHWNRPWVLLVDIDAKDIARERATEIVPFGVDENDLTDLLDMAGILDAPPAGYPYAFADIEQALEYGFEVQDIFEQDFAAEETMVVYTGQGVHVYLLDSDSAHRYDEKSREVVVDLLSESYDIPIDPVVTPDRRRVARLPYSLHADVCRLVQPISSPDFDFRSATPEVIET